MKTILVPVDFSDLTAPVVDAAVNLARGFGSRVVLLHVALPDPAFLGFDAGPAVVQEAVARDFQSEEAKLTELRDRLVEKGVDSIWVHSEGPTAETILQSCRKHGAELIVMGSHGHGALFHLLAGSVTQAVLKAAPCPVLVVPPPGK